MKKDDLKVAALKHFTQSGYEGASLSKIAEEVGIKKSSIYSHFSSKDALFLEVLREAKVAEIEMKQAYFSETENSSPKTFLYSYLVAVKQMFEENQSLKFWLRMSFFPPSHLYETILDEVLEVEVLQENMLEQSFRKWLDEDLITGPDARSLTIAYTGILMSIMVELVYDHTEKKAEEKLEACWKIYWQALDKREGIA
ncbi:TetR/AcrR family transcriptional regulator [Bacillus sp. Au-Bac7]|uniref:TetR/AcrR family transcriptional regulator n=1 Tax=Bacillus sp. Au-Bac7 TaxID=2906458 RepID=UPI001E35DF17|nr:TetR/AcrR family transcriptional regulator [Bacillus sp. Au-Bac7]MCE4048065.1 TetR/AcrR family transcriptional regulator [Bacillus sp. Au-Bac7]